MNYQQIYDNIINRGKNRVLTEYKESHHIVPRCLGGTDDPFNLVDLTPEEHYVAHQLLIKLYPTNHKLIYAAMMMSVGTTHVKRNNKQYGWLKRRYSQSQTGENHLFNRDSCARQRNQDYMRGPNNPQKLNPMKGENHPNFGKPFDPSWFTKEGLKSMAESKRGEKNPNFGVKPWNHPRATAYTKGVWAKANEIRSIWEKNDKPSYCKLYSIVNGNAVGRDWEAIGPYMSLVKYFRNGWNPTEDEEWNKL
jgi:hypothetical protein